MHIIISGGGVGGAALACSLANLGQSKNELSVTLVEKDFEKDVGSVKRGEVIRPEVTKLLDELGIIGTIKEKKPVERTDPLEEVWHSSMGQIGVIQYDILAKGYHMMYLPHRILVRALHEKLRQMDSVDVIYGAESMKFKRKETTNKPSIVYREKSVNQSKNEEEKEISGDLLVIAEGGSSNLRMSLGVETDFYDYNLGYLMVMLDRPSSIEWGRHCLSPDGFVGFFSMPDDKMRAAIEIKVSELKDWLGLDKEKIAQKIAARAPFVGNPTVYDVGSFYHVFRRHAKKYSLEDIVLIGDAAHTTHPMLGQGMSMVFHDVFALSKVIQESIQSGENSMAPRDLERFESIVRPFNKAIIENNHEISFAFQAIGKEPSLIQKYMPVLERVGFRK